MKKTIMLLLTALCGVWTAAAQDLIVRTDDTRIEARVTEVAPDAVRYKRFSNPDGPTYVLPVDRIRSIRYANGEEEVFSAAEPSESAAAAGSAAPAPQAAQVEPAVSAVPAESAESAEPAAPAATPAPAEAPAYRDAAPEVMVARTYEIGDYYNENGLRGVVCQLNEERTHGLLISMDEETLPWSVFAKREEWRTTGATDRKDGRANMAAIERYIGQNGLSWADFPAFDWCRRQGEGWYLPSIDEMIVIGHLYNGGSRIRSNRQVRQRFNDSLKNNGGKRMDRLMYYFSSTELDEKFAATSHMSIEPPYMVEIPKHNKFLVRALHRF